MDRLCKDANWGVRKACIDAAYDIATICKDDLSEHKENEMTEAVVNFLKDQNKWVKISAYKILGPFISTLQGLKINEKLVDGFIHMPDSSINGMSQDNEV